MGLLGIKKDHSLELLVQWTFCKECTQLTLEISHLRSQ